LVLFTKKTCSINPFQKCYRQHPNQLTSKEVISIENLVTDPTNFGKRKVNLYYYQLRNKLVFCSKSTLNKYASALGYIKPKPFLYTRKKGLRASLVFEWLDVDITNVNTLQDGIQKVAFVKDNFSRGSLHHSSTSGKAGSEFIKNLFSETFEKYNLLNAIKPINTLSDGRSENKGELLTGINNIQAPPMVPKITAQTKDFPCSNSMSKSTHRIYKNEFLHGKYSLNEKRILKI
jgi:hypothetical protein